MKPGPEPRKAASKTRARMTRRAAYEAFALLLRATSGAQAAVAVQAIRMPSPA